MAISQAVVRTFRKDDGGMAWDEAFKRASSYFLWLVVWSFLAELILVTGVVIMTWGLDDLASRKAGVALGIGLIMGGGALVTVTAVAVWIKATTDAVADHVEQRLVARLGNPPGPVERSHGPWSHLLKMHVE